MRLADQVLLKMFLLATNWCAGRSSLFCLRSFALLFELIGELGLASTWADSCDYAPRTQKTAVSDASQEVPYLNMHESFNKYALKDYLFAFRIFLQQGVYNQLKICRKFRTWHSKFGISLRFQLQTSNIICMTTGMNVGILHWCEVSDLVNTKNRIPFFNMIFSLNYLNIYSEIKIIC